MVVLASNRGNFSKARMERLVRNKGKTNAPKYKEDFEENLLRTGGTVSLLNTMMTQSIV